MEITVDIPRRKQYSDAVTIPADAETKFANDSSDSAIFVEKTQNQNDQEEQSFEDVLNEHDLEKQPEVNRKEIMRQYEEDKQKQLDGIYINKYQKQWFVLSDDFPVSNLFLQLMLTILIFIAALCQMAAAISNMINIQLSYFVFTRNFLVIVFDLIVALDVFKISFVSHLTFEYLQIFRYKQITACCLFVICFWSDLTYAGTIQQQVNAALHYVVLSSVGIVMLTWILGRMDMLIQTQTL